MITKTIIRKIHKIYNYCLYKVFKFGEWHLITYEDKEYAQDIVMYLNKYLENEEDKKSYVIEIGCGMGDIIKRIKWLKKIGYDISDNVLKAARISSIGKNVSYIKGTFENICQKRIKCLIMVNFIHGVHPDVLRTNMKSLLKENEVDMFVIDRLININNSPYKFSHEGSNLFEKYECIWRSKQYKAAGEALRVIELWKK